MVYVYESDSTLRDILVDVLRDDGYSVMPFESVQSLRSATASLQPSLILTDAWGGNLERPDADERQQLAELGSLAPVVLLNRFA